MTVQTSTSSTLPAGWEATTVGKHFEFAYGKGLVKAVRKGNGSFPVYGSSGIVGFHNEFIVEGPKIIVGRKGAAGAVHLCPDNCWPIDTTYFVNISEYVDIKFAYYILKNLRLNQFETSTAIPGLNRDDAYRLGISLPPIEEQHRIVNKIETLFSELDKGIEALKTTRAQLKVYRQAVLKHAFEGKLTARWRAENPDKLETIDQLLARIPQPAQPRGGREASIEVIEGVAALAVNKPVKKAPEGWTWIPLLRIARQETGHTPSRKHPEYWGGDQYWIGIVDARMSHGKVIHDTLQKPTLDGLENSSARTLPEGTVCLSRTASVGYVTIMGKPMATSQDFATWTCTEALNPKFLMYALMAEGEEIRRFGKGTTHTTIYFPEIRALHICLPPIEEQAVIVEAIERNMQKADLIETEIESELTRSETLRQSILKKAFAGQLVSQNPKDEPAITLLKPIHPERTTQAKPDTIKIAARKRTKSHT